MEYDINILKRFGWWENDAPAKCMIVGELQSSTRINLGWFKPDTMLTQEGERNYKILLKNISN